MSYYIQSESGEKFYFDELLVGQVPASKQGKALDKIRIIVCGGKDGISISFAKDLSKLYNVYTAWNQKTENFLVFYFLKNFFKEK